MYRDVLKVPHQQGVKGAHKHGILFGFSQAAQYFGWGITTYYGGYLVVRVSPLHFNKKLTIFLSIKKNPLKSLIMYYIKDF